MPSETAGRPTSGSGEARNALERIAHSAVFSRSEQLQRLLRFLVEETLAGRGDRLKEYVIGVEVFGRPADFDPRLDSLVRVQARRLRHALAAYYADEGRADPVVVELQKGGYHPTFGPPLLRSAAPGGAPLPVRRGSDAEAPGDAKPATVSTPRRWFRAANILLLSAVLLALVASAAAWLLRTRQVHALSDRDSIVLAGFRNSTGESIFDETLEQGLAVGLEQSRFLNIVSDRRVAQLLRLMGRPPGERLSKETAREACVRAGSKALITGSITRLGTHYAIGLTASDCQTGDEFAHAQAEAPGREAVLAALDAAATQLRGKLGESLASVRQSDVQLEEATTSSLEALQAYSLGRKAARDRGSPADIPFYKRAIDLDPDFAIAHAALGVSYVNLAQPSVAASHLEKAFGLRERVSDRERFRIAAYYYHAFAGDLEQARGVYEQWTASYPRDMAPHINLGLTYLWKGEYEKALSVTSDALLLEPDNVLPYSNVAALLIKLERPSEAAATLERARARGLTSRFVRSNLCYLAFLANDDSVMEEKLAEVRDVPGEEDLLLSQASDTAAYRGRIADARQLSRRAVEAARRGGASEAAASWLVNSALREAEVGNVAEARRQVRDALRLAAGRDVVALAALASARAGDLARSEALVRDLEPNHPLNTVIQKYWLPTIRAAVALAGAHPEAAVDALRVAAPYELGSPPPMGLATLYPIHLRGEAYLLARDGVGAAVEFRKVLAHPGLVLNCPLHALARLQLARASRMSRDASGARQAYQEFFAVWKTADPDVPLLKQARAEYDTLR